MLDMGDSNSFSVTGMSFRMYFVDDSGEPTRGIAVYSWIEVDTAQATEAMNVWLRFRQQLFERHQIPTDVEIHSTNFLAGRGHPSTEDKVNKSKIVRREIFIDALKIIGDLPGVSIGAVYRSSPRRRNSFAEAMRETFCRLVLGIDRRLFLGNLQGIIVIDGEGDGSCRFYTRVYRSLNLSGQQLIAGPFFEPSYDSQWIQIADIVAYTAFSGFTKNKGPG